MSFYTKLKIILSIILSVSVSILLYNYLGSLKEEVSVIIATKDIPQRTWIKPDMLKIVKVRKSDKQILVPNSFSDIKDLEIAISKIDISSGRVIDKKNDIITGSMQALKEMKVVNSDGSINNGYFLSDNHRLVTVRVDSQGCVDNKLQCGDYVDIVFTSNDSKNLFSADILQHIEVFSIQKVSDTDDVSYQNITLSVTPQQAVDIVFAKRNGKIDLVLNSKSGERELVVPSNLQKIINQFTFK